MEALLHQVLGGLANGGIYASLALALVMIYQATHLVNFAQGEMAMCSTYLASAMIQAGLPYWVAFIATVALSFVMGALIQRVILRRAERAPVLSVVIIFIGLLLTLNSLAGWVFTYTIRTFPSPFPAEPLFGNPYIGTHDVGAIGTTLVVLLLLYGFFRFTSLGLALRAVAENPESSRLVGIRVGSMLALGWGLAAGIGAVAGMMIAPVVFLDPNMMSGVMLYAFAAALLGGIDNPTGAVFGGFAVGVLENVIGSYVVGTELKLTVALVLILGVLVVRPTGLFGKTLVTRV
ncbi:branched-chain amino acid ABC transporter permease [Pendulispora rubella]|uniref:Branched-chain amino acid ABC transporter permease n=1 Tax=Pendulispora rubella TaxID=2741070 RepID=A0ABZ2LLI0_9BACT